MPRLLHELFAASLHRGPDRIALELPPQGTRPRLRLSYAELDAAAEALRATLPRSLPREGIVAIHLPKSSPWVHAAQLAVLRAGGAFTCLDESLPDEHVRFVLDDAAAEAVLTDVAGAARLRRLGVPDALLCTTPPTAGEQAPPPPPSLPADSLAYVIYTSGTTGRPKGVLIEHRSIVHLLEAEQAHFGLRPEDRCVQVSSHVYDSALEEAWLPFSAGATVVVADEQVTRSGPDLVPWLREERITVLMPTPTLLRACACEDPLRELPELRLIYAGGEALPAELVERWAPGRWLENGYGPTECTITVTRARVLPGHVVTIGTPIGANVAHVLDARLEPVEDGERGELCLAGPGLARGYLRRPELTAERFVDDPRWGRLYRTGDLVHRDAHGQLHYHGRLDAQIKLRGHRIELGQIESTLCALPGIREAACTVQGESGHERLVCFFAPSDPARIPSEADIGSELARRLPAAMCPARIAPLPQLPRTPGGKLDRRALPDLAPASAAQAQDADPPRDEVEARLVCCLAAALDLPGLGRAQDFFELGGNSLRAAVAISHLRREPDCGRLTVRDLYEHRNVASLAARLRDFATQSTRPLESALPPVPEGAPKLVTLLQATALLLGLAAGSFAVWAGLFLVLPWLCAGLGLLGFVLLSPLLASAGLLLYVPFALGLAVATKRLLIGQYRPLRAPAFGSFTFRHWLVVRAVQLVPWRLLEGTVFVHVGLRLLGAKIGRRVHVHRGVDLFRGGWDLLEIGDDVSLAQDAALGLVEFDRGELVLAPVRLGHGSTLDVRAAVEGDASLGDGARLAPLSALESGDHVPAGELWDGVPARPTGERTSDRRAPVPEISPAVHGVALIAWRGVIGIALGVPALGVLFVLLLLAGIDLEAALDWLFAPLDAPGVFVLAAALASFGLVAELLVRGLLLRWTRAVPSGVHGRWSRTYWRIWLRTGLLEGAGRWLSGSLFWRWWLRLAGLRLGKNAEVSTILDVLPECIAIGDESFFADGIYLGGPIHDRGLVRVAATRLGAETFLGNHVVVPAGSDMPEGLLLGVSTCADPARMGPGTSWFGHPPFALPQREVVTLERSLTHAPPPRLVVQRLFWESLRFALPAVLLATLLVWLELVARHGAAFAPLASLLLGTGLALLVLALKWLLLGRVRPGQHGLWSGWCCRWDFLYMAWGMLARGVLAPFEGTLLLAGYLRAMGMRIGKRVVLARGFAQVVDPDMLELGDRATVDPLFQAHSFEDRVLKIGLIRIGPRATVRRSTVLFYGAELEADVHVGPHSVVMKNEELKASRRYQGCPVRPLDAGATTARQTQYPAAASNSSGNAS